MLFLYRRFQLAPEPTKISQKSKYYMHCQISTHLPEECYANKSFSLLLIIKQITDALYTQFLYFKKVIKTLAEIKINYRALVDSSNILLKRLEMKFSNQIKAILEVSSLIKSEIDKKRQSLP